jgi:hypothetical protein
MQVGAGKALPAGDPNAHEAPHDDNGERNEQQRVDEQQREDGGRRRTEFTRSGPHENRRGAEDNGSNRRSERQLAVKPHLPRPDPAAQIEAPRP